MSVWWCILTILTSGRRRGEERCGRPELVLSGQPNGRLLWTWSILPSPTMAALQSFAFWFLIFLSWTQSESYRVEEISDHSEPQRSVGGSSWSNSNLDSLHSHKYRDSDSEPSKLQRSSHFTRSRLKTPREGKCKFGNL